jgi:hypothetical protein
MSTINNGDDSNKDDKSGGVRNKPEVVHKQGEEHRLVQAKRMSSRKHLAEHQPHTQTLVVQQQGQESSSFVTPVTIWVKQVAAH